MNEMLGLDFKVTTGLSLLDQANRTTLLLIWEDNIKIEVPAIRETSPKENRQKEDQIRCNGWGNAFTPPRRTQPRSTRIQTIEASLTSLVLVPITTTSTLNPLQSQKRRSIGARRRPRASRKIDRLLINLGKDEKRKTRRDPPQAPPDIQQRNVVVDYIFNQMKT
ncbi:hypothetical protein CHS0354_012584 [Potamilus streckersoni]|uniref:Uncharacterized protein n=1 Tax=Potamilus streckersoni TaxID=2493646 RepID=A0AAE0W4H5_9BIVA|nr:hypothetical protein CHS0354_012584 [Potamilus streckersoni]